MRFCPKFFSFSFFLACLYGTTPALAQQSYWVIFKDKPTALPSGHLISPDAQANRQKLGLASLQQTDLPISTAYLDSIARRQIKITAVSKWLNAAAVTLTPAQADALVKASFVKSLQKINGYFTAARVSASSPGKKMSQALAQLHPEAIFEKGLTGKGVKVGVIDAGFYGAPTHPALAAIFTQGRVAALRDFVDPLQKHPYALRESLLDNHGTEVLLRIGGYNPDAKEQTGLAPKATFYLARTDHGKFENRLEEAHFVRALEWLDSLGVRLVNSSLGYGTGFDNPAENYQPQQMDGSSFIAKSVQLAIEEKGMTIIVSAGNDGGKKSWQIINTPADAPSVLAIGATKPTTWTKQGYSGIGPAFLPYLKPDLACFSAEGTSFSAPVITGLAACLLELNPALTNIELTQILKQSGHLYPYGNNYLGFGVPNASRALALAQGSLAGTSERPKAAPMVVTGKSFQYKISQDRDALARNGGIVVYRKSSATQVIRQEKHSMGSSNIKLKRLPQETHTTLQIGTEVIELVWL